MKHLKKYQALGAFTRVELIVVVVVCIVSFVVMIEVLSRFIPSVKERSNTQACLNNIRQVGTALYMTMSDTRVFPNNNTGLKSDPKNYLFRIPCFSSYCKDTKTLECPRDNGLSPSSSCFNDSNKTDPMASYYYAYNDDANLIRSIFSSTYCPGGRLTAITSPCKKVVFYEKTLTTRTVKGWHNKLQSGVCVFADQHSALMVATNVASVAGTDNADFY